MEGHVSSTGGTVRLLLECKGMLQSELSEYEQTIYFLQAISSAELSFTVGRMNIRKSKKSELKISD